MDKKERPGQGAHHETTPPKLISSRRFRIREQFRKRRVSAALDRVCGVDRGRLPVPYGSAGMNLDWRERERAGGVAPE